MPANVCKRSLVALRAARAWPLWELPRWLVGYMGAVAVCYTVALWLTARSMHQSFGNLWLFAALLLCIAATVELMRRAGEVAGVSKDVFAVWEFPIAILLPPVYALTAPLLQYALMQWRVRRMPLHRRAFTALVVGLSYGLVSVLFHQATAVLPGPDPRAHIPVWLAAVAGAGVLRWALNQALIMPAIKASDPAARARDILFSAERAQNDVAELCVAVLVTLGIAITPLTIVFALPLVTLLERSLRHGELLNASRLDSKTGLLNAGTWEREAANEAARAVRTRTPLALVLIDVDHFKAVNDLYGHLVGDKALRAIAHTFQIFLRDYDLVGRFGGEEFALLLPQTSATDARRIAERVRGHIEAMPISVSDTPGAESLQVTVSMGVAALGLSWDAATGSQLTDLLAGADRALYQAKRAGRNQVWVVTDHAADRATAGSVADGSRPGL